MNHHEQRLLEISPDWLASKPHVCELSPLSEHEHVKRRVRQKITDGGVRADIDHV